MPNTAEPSERHRSLGKGLVTLLILGGVVTYLYLGRNLWFYSDEWDYLVNRSVAKPATLFQSHNGQWQTIPILIYRGLLNFTGLHTYLPYLVLVVLVYAIVCRLSYAVMQRAGVAPWIAALLVGALVFLGFANENVVFGAQITYLGSIAIGLWQVLLVDDGADFRRGAQIAVLGILALMCSNLGVVTAVVVFVYALARGNWKLAIGVTVPPAAAFLVWTHYYGSVQGTGVGPTVRFVGVGLRAAGQDYLQHGDAGVVVLAVLLVAGLALAVGLRVRLPDRLVHRRSSKRPPVGRPTPQGRSAASRSSNDRSSDERSSDERSAPKKSDERSSSKGSGGRSALAVGLAFLLGALAFLAVTGSQRSTAFGVSSAAQPRYAGIVVILLLPVAGLAAGAFWRLFKPAGVVAVAILLVGVPGNVHDLSQITARATEVQQVRALILAVPTLPQSATVPADMRPFPESHTAPSLTVGYLRHAKSDGDLPPSKTPSEAIKAQDEFRLAIYQTDAATAPRSCQVLTRPVSKRVKRGSVLYLRGGLVGVINQTRGAAYGLSLYYNPNRGDELRILAGPLTLQLRTYGVNGAAALCTK